MEAPKLEGAPKPAPPPNATFYKIPPGTKPGQCDGPDCRARIYWIANPKKEGKRLPIDTHVIGGETPSETRDTDQGDIFSHNGLAYVREGRGINHLTICPNRENFG